MIDKRIATFDRPPARWYRGTDVTMRVIRRFARQVAEYFHPEKIILFGSHAYGTPHADSDVDILVVMPCQSQHSQAFKIRCAVPAQFPMDLRVIKPHQVEWRLREGESFLTEIMTKGKTLYEKNDTRVATQSRKRFPARHRHAVACASSRIMLLIHGTRSGALPNAKPPPRCVGPAKCAMLAARFLDCVRRASAASRTNRSNSGRRVVETTRRLPDGQSSFMIVPRPRLLVNSELLLLPNRST